MKRFFSKKVLLWPFALFAAAAIVAVVALVPTGVLDLVGFGSETRDSEVITSITREEEVVLLRLGIRDIEEDNDQFEVLGVKVPGTERASFIKYEFDAKLGFDGENVRISKTGDDTFLVSVPQFIFIGHDNEKFGYAIEENGVLSWLTGEIDAAGMIDTILNDGGTKQGYIDSNAAVLKDQTEAFYNGIIASIDSTIQVEYEFR